MMPKSARKPKTVVHYEITVWNQTNGDIEKKLWDATEDELVDVREQFEDEPWCEVVIDRSWEEREQP